MLNKADRVVAQSSDTQGNAIKYYGVTRNIDIIPLGIKKPKFEPSSRERFGLPKDAFVMVTIGRLVKRKNLEDAIKILSTLKEFGCFRLIIIGDGPEMDNLRNLVKQSHLGNNVIFFGNVDDETKFQLLDVSDLYVSTATHEGFGLVFIEAMALRIPVICYNRGGQNDFLDNSRSGYLIELNNKEEFINRIFELYNDRKKLEGMSQFCKSVAENYYIENCADRYLNLFRDASRKVSFHNTYRRVS
jgi:glycosyltransferase involved in cell wall biosynthesis